MQDIGSRLLQMTLALVLAWSPALAGDPEPAPGDQLISVGVLARRGLDQAVEQWQPTAEYLNQEVPGFRFELVPLDFNAIHLAVHEAEVDFILSNSAYFVDLELNHGIRAIATLLNRRLDKSTPVFGGVILCRADRPDIRQLADLEGKSFMAVDPRSFGGWHVAWYELLSNGISPREDFSSLEFGGTHDAVVHAIRDGKVDAGAIRTDTLERMAQEGKIRPDDFRVLNPRHPGEEFPFQLSTRLYPEWPMACLPHVDPGLVKKVAIALLEMPEASEAARAARASGWTVGLNYQPVHDCLKTLRVAPYTDFGKVTWQQAMRKQSPLLIGLLTILLMAVGFSVRLKGLNGRLSRTLKQLDEELDQRRQAEAALSNFKRTLDQVHDCVFIFDAETLRFVYANQGAVHQVGYTSEELEAMRPLDVEPQFTDASFRELLTPLLRGEKESMTFETDHRRKDGSFVPVEVMLQYVVPGEDGRFVAVVRDINERLKAQKEKEKLQARLLHVQKLESVGRLAAGVAHEINTPVQFISSNVEFLDEGFQGIAAFLNRLRGALEAPGDLDVEELKNELKNADWDYLADEIPNAIKQSVAGLKQVSSIVVAMMDFSHPGNTEKVPSDLNRIVETTVTVAHNEWKNLAEVTTDLAPGLPPVPCLAGEIGQVILNLLVNAAQAIADKADSRAEGAKGAIRISTRGTERGVELRMSDDGAGIPPEHLDRIFDPFFSTREVGSGSGQGLAISHDVIVGKHGGSLSVESEPGVGSTFTFTLPFPQ